VLQLEGRTARYGAAAGPGLALLFLVLFCGLGVVMMLSALGMAGEGLLREAPRGILFSFGALFVFCGGAFGIQAARRFARARRAQHMRSEYPDQPWRWERTWPETLRDESTRELAQGILVPLAFGLFLFPFHWIGLTQEGAGVFLVATLLFDVFVLVYLGKAVYLAVRYVRLGTSRLVLSRVPCSLG
jgi:hypothetical protein